MKVRDPYFRLLARRVWLPYEGKERVKMYRKKKELLAKICHLLYTRNLVSACDGNVSLRVSEESILITPSGINKGFVSAEEMLLVDFTGDSGCIQREANGSCGCKGDHRSRIIFLFWKGQGDQSMEKDKKIYMVGNTHIDPVWLWKRGEGMQEVKSSFASALERLKEFKDFKFTHSSISYLAWMKENCPELFAQIIEREREGRWEIAGGMWTEPDCDLPSGESFIRHFLYGKKFAEEHFSKEVDTVYNVDSFGHGSNLPNIYRHCGMKHYLISRPGRACMKVPPVFLWKAKDGSSVVTEMTGGEYMAWTKPAIVENLEDSLAAMEEYGQDKMAVFYGVGNHGGGPTIENIRSIYELMEERPELSIEFASIRDFFLAMEGAELPAVEGEIGRIFYGCYSSDNEIKRQNRAAEWTLLKAETLAMMAAHYAGARYEHPSERLETAWKEVLFNQFHDVLAGTSIEPARNEAVQEFTYAIASGRSVINQAVQAIANALDTRGDGFPLLLINPTGENYEGVVFADVYLPRAEKKQLRIKNPAGKEVPFAETAYRFYTKESRKGILLEASVPAYGYAMYRYVCEGSENTEYENKMMHSDRTISNGVITLTFDEKTGCPSSLLNNGRELLAEPASVKVFYDDRGAWGRPVYEEVLSGSFSAISQGVLESNFLRTVYRSCLEYDKSELVLDFILEKDKELVSINGWIHNHERHSQIAFSVPMEGDALSCATETGFLVEERPLRDGSEYYQHRFADLRGKDGAGMAVFNSSAYGMRWKGGEYLCILSRSAMFARGSDGPADISIGNRFMDQGVWEFELALLPHGGETSNQQLFPHADRMHMKVECLADSNHPGTLWGKQGQVVRVSGEGIAASVVKRGEHQREAVIVRFFETEGRETEAVVEAGTLTDQKTYRCKVMPYEIKTLSFLNGSVREVSMIEKLAQGKKAKGEQH